jgi:hypothetical protein
MQWRTLAEVRERHAQAVLDLENLRIAYRERVARDGDIPEVQQSFKEVMGAAVKRVTDWNKIAQYAMRLKSEEEHDYNQH